MNQHVPVLVDEVVRHLAIKADGIYIDGTFGRGGHSQAILKELGPSGRVLAIDRDPEAVQVGAKLACGEPRLTVEQGSFGQLRVMLEEHKVFGAVDGVLLDLGVSAPQLENASRGFSFLLDGPLDMRMDPTSLPSAEDWLATADQSEIARVIARFGEERAGGRIARAICAEREIARISSTAQLTAIIEKVIPRRGSGKHPATRTFQAIRIYINKELDELRSLLDQVVDALAVGGRLCVISFHSLEDRLVKRFIRDHSRVDPALSVIPRPPESVQPRLKPIGRAIRPAAKELAQNPRARSAVMRAAERLR
jgi:16S rRNA (cytosine1402-N4)-methyltransferase